MIELITYAELIIWGIIFLFVVIKFIQSIRIVPTRKAYIVERLGKYSKTLKPGFHALFPFLDSVTYILDLKEEAIEVPPQICFTLDNVRVEVDGVIYISVVNPERAAYGVTNYRDASIQLAQTTMRSIIGTLELDKTFEERDLINAKIVGTLTEVQDPWGMKIHRYEVKNIVPPQSVKQAMEKQMTAERDRRAQIATSEGKRESLINNSEGFKIEMVNRSEGEKQKRINEAEGKAQEIEAIAQSTANAIEAVAAAINNEGGEEAVQMQLSQRFLKQLSSLAKKETNILLPADLTRIDKLLDSLGIMPSSAKQK